MEIRAGDGLSLGRIVLTLGSFDGVHRGHRRLLDRLIAMAERLRARSAVVTFDPHPREVLSPGSAPPLLTTPAERERLLDAAGIDLLVRLAFDASVADTLASDFVLGRLMPLGDVAGFVVGYDFHFGKGRGGNAELLASIGRERGFEVERVAAESDGTVEVKSTGIRELVSRGDLRAAERLLGHSYFARGRVVHGEGRGRTLGFRTANVEVPDSRKLLPPNGVYAVRASGEESSGDPFVERGVANLGVRPTFGGGPRVLEVHLLDGERALYGREISVQFVERLRDEMRFETPEALAAQIGRDAERARGVLGEPDRAGEAGTAGRNGLVA